MSQFLLSRTVLRSGSRAAAKARARVDAWGVLCVGTWWKDHVTSPVHPRIRAHWQDHHNLLESFKHTEESLYKREDKSQMLDIKHTLIQPCWRWDVWQLYSICSLKHL